jgi:hypothetical protein
VSIVSMTSVAFARRTDTAPAKPNSLSDVNTAAHGEAPGDAITNAMGAIVTYFPTEINVLYTAIIAAISTPDVEVMTGQWVAFWFILVITPLGVWFIYASRVRADNKPFPLHPRTWPWVEMIISAVAYAVWAGALPGSPLREIDLYSSTLAGVVLLVATVLLAWIASLLQTAIPVSRPIEGKLNTDVRSDNSGG